MAPGKQRFDPSNVRRLRAILLFSLHAGCADANLEDRIAIRGSDSEVNLVQRLAERFMALRPNAFVSVTGGGSGVGIAALIDGTCDLANSSRPLHPEEKLLALRSKVSPVSTVFAADALTVIVNEENPVEGLDVKTIGALFRGDIESWSELGGKQKRVIAYGRQASSGTYAWFRAHVVEGEYDDEARQMNGTAQIVDAVARDPGGIGYVAVGYLESGGRGVKALEVRAGTASGGVSPLDEAAVMAGRYPIARPLFQLSSGPPTGILKEFIDFELSEEGSRIIRKMGFFPRSALEGLDAR